MEELKFSVLMSVYKKENAEYFKQAMDSVINQTLKPEQIVLVRDGEVPELLQQTIDEYLQNYSELFTYVPIEQNGGLGSALNLGLTYCRNELVARMDTDDICVPDRFEKQVAFFKENPEIDIVGGNIAEFSESIEKIIDYRVVPKTQDEISKRIKTRSPLNHVTVMFKKTAVLNAGNYQPFHFVEDWYLWIRMYLSNYKFGNLDENLCFVRVTDMSDRRGGYKYYKSLKEILKYMREKKMISYFSYTKSKMIRFGQTVLLPNKLRAWAYKIFLRK